GSPKWSETRAPLLSLRAQPFADDPVETFRRERIERRARQDCLKLLRLALAGRGKRVVLRRIPYRGFRRVERRVLDRHGRAHAFERARRHLAFGMDRAEHM